MADSSENVPSDAPIDVDVDDISPLAWRLLRTAAGFEQRTVERELDGIIQAHISMLERDRRGLSHTRRHALLELYAAELTDRQVRVLIEAF